MKVEAADRLAVSDTQEIVLHIPREAVQVMNDRTIITLNGRPIEVDLMAAFPDERFREMAFNAIQEIARLNILFDISETR